MPDVRILPAFANGGTYTAFVDGDYSGYMLFKRRNGWVVRFKGLLVTPGFSTRQAAQDWIREALA